jgi:glycosyltransferase involved in cell wall biosynthesis
MKQQVTEFGLPPERVHVIPCGTAVEPRLERSYPEKQEYTAIVLGRLVPKKGIMFVLESFRRLVGNVAAQLLVVGDGPMGESARQYVEAVGIGPRVRFLGELPNDRVRQLLRTADVLLQHSVTAENGDTEGVPVSILEAMAEGVPVVATRHAGIPHAVADGVTGFLVEPTDCGEMSRRTAEILTKRQLRESMAVAAHKRILEHFSLEAELSALRTVIARHGLA